LPEVVLRALAPGSHEIVVETRANERTGNRDEAARPLFDDLNAGLSGDPLDNTRNEAMDHFPLQQFAADVHPGGAGGGDPQLRSLFFRVVFKPIQQTELLNGTESNPCKNRQVGNDGDEAAEAETGALGSSHFHTAANDASRKVI